MMLHKLVVLGLGCQKRIVTTAKRFPVRFPATNTLPPQLKVILDELMIC